MNNSLGNGVGASSCVRPLPDEQSLRARGRTQGDAPTPLQQISSGRIESRDTSSIDSSATCELDAEGHCITCSDEALTARVLSVDEVMGFASVAIEDALDEVDITLLDEVAEGDLILVHGGVAIAKVGASPCGCPLPNEQSLRASGHPQGDAPTSDEANNA